jgi:hypothetical protein
MSGSRYSQRRGVLRPVLDPALCAESGCALFNTAPTNSATKLSLYSANVQIGLRGQKRKWRGSKGDKSFASPTYPLPLHRYVCLPLHVMSGCCSGWRYRAQVTSSMSLGRQVLLIHGSSGPYIRRMGNQLLPGMVSSQLSSSPSGGLGAK